MMLTTAEVTMPRRPLLRSLGLAFGLAVVIGETVGVGIMRTSGPIAGRLGEPWLIYLVWLGVGIYVLMIASILAELATAMPGAGVLLAPRILYGMGRDGLFVSSGTYVTRQGVPVVGVWLSAAGATLVAVIGGFDTLYTAAAFLNTCGFLSCGAALFALRIREPNLRRPYLAFGYPWVPGFALLASALLLIVFVLGNTRPSLIALAAVVATYPVFTFLRRKTSRARQPGDT